MKLQRWISPALIAAGSLLGGGALAQTPAPASAAAGTTAPGFVSRPIAFAPISGDDTKEAVLITATLAAGAATPVHTHPGDCIGTVVEGAIEMRIAGQPPKRYVAGEAYSSPRGTVHQLANVGEGPARFLNTLIVDKGKPRIQPQAGEAR